MNNRELLQKIIDDKYIELGYETLSKDNIFWKSRFFEGNAIGQIGEIFVSSCLY